MKGSRKDDQHAEELSRELARHVDRTAADPTAQLPFVSVPVARFVLMSLVTFSLYEIWWFYRNWKRVKERTGSDIRPFWRAVFSPIFCYQFVQTVRTTSEKVSVAAPLSAGGIAFAYVAFMLCERLPDPWWWLSMLTFVPLLPVVQHIAQLHHSVYPGFTADAPFGKGHVLTVLVGLPLTALAVLGTFSPSTRALRGDELPGGYYEKLVELGHVEPDERVLWFYSAGLWSIEEDGNVLTDRRVVSYEQSAGQVWRESVPYEGIADVGVTWSEGSLEDTIVTVTTADDRVFSLVVSAEGGRDHEFVDEIESLRQARASVD